jgi:protein-S-isoprenylcysteine O-methyltransferase Ste14
MSSVLGRLAFPLYSVFFMLLLFSRPVLILALALADRGSLAISPSFLWGLAAALLLPVGYVFYSVLRYFGIQRALGIDHFDRSYRDRPLVDGGIFRYVRNGMYLYGLLILYIPGLLLASEASLLAAFFQHTYIWVHYFTLEAPDMQIIFADRPPGRAKWGS